MGLSGDDLTDEVAPVPSAETDPTKVEGQRLHPKQPPQKHLERGTLVGRYVVIDDQGIMIEPIVRYLKYLDRIGAARKAECFSSPARMTEAFKRS